MHHRCIIHLQNPVLRISIPQACSQCGATKTPMWRNDTNGNKTLCNACGVRLQRQLNKQKQQSQAAADNPTSLLAGKLPRCRTSPAKLSRQDLARSSSPDALKTFESPPQKTSNRSLTLVHNASGQPTLTIAGSQPKRKGQDAPLAFTLPKLEERKRVCNDKAAACPWPEALDAGVPADLLIPNGRAPNVRPMHPLLAICTSCKVAHSRQPCS